MEDVHRPVAVLNAVLDVPIRDGAGDISLAEAAHALAIFQVDLRKEVLEGGHHRPLRPVDQLERLLGVGDRLGDQVAIPAADMRQPLRLDEMRKQPSAILLVLVLMVAHAAPDEGAQYSTAVASWEGPRARASLRPSPRGDTSVRSSIIGSCAYRSTWS
ncbi:MAG TPA: hypothetical protein VN874_09030 [Myxococcales bacterium]|nr:hypothetical protein [Myxococcales bacterium]